MTRGARSAAALALAVVATLGIAAASGGARKSIRWQSDFDKARTMAAKQKRIMMVDFYADW